MADFWVFAYGSLMWDPGFAPAASVPALLRGYHRRFCVYSHRYRGTKERPGLVLGLDRGGACRGMGFHVAADQADEVRAYLWQREMPTGLGYAYCARTVALTLATGAAVSALAFVVDRASPQYTGRLDDDAAARLIAAATGARGANHAYLDSTIAHIRAMGLRDRSLERLAARVHHFRAAEPAVAPGMAP